MHEVVLEKKLDGVAANIAKKVGYEMVPWY